MPLLQRLFPAAILSLALLTLALAALFLNGYQFPAAQAQTTPTTVDYDSNDDGLIEISNLAQLNAVRWDLDGDGAADVATNNTTYAAAFPNAATGMGCPDGSDADTTPDPCLGYELKADLTFDTNGDGSVTATDSGGLYWNQDDGWTPIGGRGNPYTGEFQGRGKAISHLYINDYAVDFAGLFGVVGKGGKIAGLGLTNGDIYSGRRSVVGSLAGINEGTITASYATGNIRTGNNGAVAGGLVGLNLLGTLQASFAQVTVAASHQGSVAGGLAGQNLLGDIKAGYAAGAVSATGSNARAGGLVGVNQGTIEAGYARGRVAVSGSGSAGGGLTAVNTGTVTVSYWDTAATGQTASAGGTGQSSSALQTPTGYAGLYDAWNLNLDGSGSADSPWDFGSSAQYPILVYGDIKAAPQRDYDSDNDRLLEVNSLAQLNAIRWDLNTDGIVAAADQANYAAAFPGPLAGMGCAEGTATATCTGYELNSDLDFDIDGDGGIDADDGFHWNRSLGWEGIGSSANPFTGTFQGNSKTIANLYVNRTQPDRVGLFGEIGSTGVVAGVKLRAVDIGVLGGSRIGALAGVNGGTIRLSSATGRISAHAEGGTIYAGGLVGSNTGRIVSSYAKAEITDSPAVAGGLAGHNGSSGSIVASYSAGLTVTTGNNAYLGGLVGHNQGAITVTYSRSPVKATGNTAAVGGLVGYNQRTDSASTTQGTITDSYTRGPVVATGTGTSVGGLVGKNSGGTATNSYWDTELSGQSGSALGVAKAGQESYAALGNSNPNLDGVAGGDDPWFFTPRQYPLLDYGGIDVVDQIQFYLWDEPRVGYTARTSWHVARWLTRDPGHGGFIWERSADGITWTTVYSRKAGIGRIRTNDWFALLIEPFEANQHFRVHRKTRERGWVYGYISEPAPDWSGPTATLTFASGHATPRVGQAIAISGTDNVKWIRCDDAAGNGCEVLVVAATSYTPAAADQGKYLYAYRYYDNAQSVKTMGKTAAIGPVAAASPSS